MRLCRAGCDGIVGLAEARHWISPRRCGLLTGHEGLVAIHAGRRALSRIHAPHLPDDRGADHGGNRSRRLAAPRSSSRRGGAQARNHFAAHMLPSIAVCDPELTYGLPPGLTAATGMDAISHCSETLMAPALQSARRCHCHGWAHPRLAALLTAVRDGSDKARAQRHDGLRAGGAMAFQKGLVPCTR